MAFFDDSTGDDFEEVTFNAAALNLKEIMEKLNIIDALSEAAEDKPSRYLPKYKKALRVLSSRLRTFTRLNGEKVTIERIKKDFRGDREFTFNDLEDIKDELYDIIASTSIGDKAQKKKKTLEEKIAEEVPI